VRRGTECEYKSMHERVGASQHSPIKHALYRILGGQCIGAASKIDKFKKTLLVEACAGDGNPNEYSGTSSPEISYRLVKGSLKLRQDIRCLLIEKREYTAEQLVQNLCRQWDDGYLLRQEGEIWIRDEALKYIEVIPGDYRSEAVADRIAKLIMPDETTVFLYIDPNKASDVELSEWLKVVLPWATTMLITLGCNVGGSKRLPIEHPDRESWYERLEYLLRLKRQHHDACLIRLERDGSQWAYLVTVPRVWRERTDKSIVALCKLHWPKGIQICWLSDSKKAFWNCAAYLFLTKAERGK